MSTGTLFNALDPRALLIFHQVGRSQSVSGAARAMHVSQPAVSAAMQLLEARLGHKLFHRSSTGIRLTEEGHALWRRADEVATLLRKAVEDVTAAASARVGPLHVGGTPGALLTLLPAIMQRIDAHYDNVPVHIYERPDGELMELLRQRKIDMAVVTTRMEPPPPDLREITVARDQFVLVAGAEHGDLADSVSLRDVAALRWVLPDAQGAFRRQVDALFISAGVSLPTQVIRCDSLLTTKAVVAATGRVTILPMRVVADDVAAGTLRAISLIEMQFARNVGVRLLADATPSPVVAFVLEGLREEE
ncbi:LysR family transcriptional regulator [Novosphingobium sp. FSY-8]|uniref:LysR family transcriptional regulator n=1 Tax=Novosphingobium ovatum TaxID=1908523 RepID=A0ABW9XHU4_9SPHN|nr:LysR family transcriptional regulator [Novosphingobium ovatum]NBC38145.1 LysR family transcriptional regulator [Novosphingobium ovatum]